MGRDPCKLLHDKNVQLFEFFANKMKLTVLWSIDTKGFKVISSQKIKISSVGIEPSVTDLTCHALWN